MKTERLLVCSYDIHHVVLKLFLKRKIIAERHCPPCTFYYWNNKGRMRTVDDRGIWAAVLDEDYYPTGFIKLIRKFK